MQQPYIHHDFWVTSTYWFLVCFQQDLTWIHFNQWRIISPNFTTGFLNLFTQLRHQQSLTNITAQTQPLTPTSTIGVRNHNFSLNFSAQPMILTYTEIPPMRYFNFFGFYIDSPPPLSLRLPTPVILYEFNYTYLDDKILTIQSRFLLLSSSFVPTLTSFYRFSTLFTTH